MEEVLITLQADKLHANDNMDCHNLADNNNCASTFLCDDVEFPAGFLILNVSLILSHVPGAG